MIEQRLEEIGVRILADKDKDPDAWFRARAAQWTASELAPLVGLGDDSAAVATRNKAESRRDPKIDRLVQVRSGLFLEPGIIAWYADDCLYPVIPNARLLDNPSAGMPIAATPDALELVDTTIIPLEVKNVQHESAHNWHLQTTDTSGWDDLGIGPFPVPTDCNILAPFMSMKVASKDAQTVRGAFRRHAIEFRKTLLPMMGPTVAPLKYWVQLQSQMAVLGAPYGRIVCLAGGCTRITLTYAYDPLFVAKMVDEATKAWQNVLRLRDRL